MKVVIPSKSANEPLEKRFNRFAKALMAVPKKELDEKPERKKTEKRKKKT
jgi:hypothetical protein